MIINDVPTTDSGSPGSGPAIGSFGGRLTSADYDNILSFIHTVAELDHPDRFAETVADQIGTVVDCDVTSLNDVDPTTAALRSVVSPRDYPIDGSVVDALGELAGQHPLIAHMSATGDGSAIKITDFWTTAQWHESELYARVYAPMRIEHQIAIALPTPQPAVVGLALNRHADRDFSERDRSVLNRVRPHLAQSWRHAGERSRLRTLLATAGDALDAYEVGVILLSEPLSEVTPGVLTDLYRFHGRPSDRTPLPTRVQRWLDQERAQRRRGGLADLARPLTTIRGGRRMVVRFLPATAARQDALLVRITPEPQLPQELGALGLTARETQILTALTTGATNSQLAAQLHLSPATVKNHLDHIYRKLGAHTRVQATTIALTMLGGEPAGPPATP